MTYSPTFWDFLLLGAIVASIPVDPLVSARLRAAIASGKNPRARLTAVWFTAGTTWLLTFAILALWIHFARPWSALWLGKPNTWRLAAGLLLAGAHLWYVSRARSRMLSKPERFPRYRELFDSVSHLLPQTAAERSVFPLVAVTAGFGEELITRGFIFSLFTSMFGLGIGAVVNVAIFGLGHAYQGRAGIIRTAGFAAVATLIVVATGSLWPVILIHTFQDLVMGDVGSRVFMAEPASTPA